jgi:hypothetical protein
VKIAMFAPLTFTPAVGTAEVLPYALVGIAERRLEHQPARPQQMVPWRRR